MTERVPPFYAVGAPSSVWIAGIVSFTRDVRHKVVPGVRRHRRERAAEREREESVRQRY